MAAEVLHTADAKVTNLGKTLLGSPKDISTRSSPPLTETDCTDPVNMCPTKTDLPVNSNGNELPKEQNSPEPISCQEPCVSSALDVETNGGNIPYQLSTLSDSQNSHSGCNENSNEISPSVVSSVTVKSEDGAGNQTVIKSSDICSTSTDDPSVMNSSFMSSQASTLESLDATVTEDGCDLDASKYSHVDTGDYNEGMPTQKTLKGSTFKGEENLKLR